MINMEGFVCTKEPQEPEEELKIKPVCDPPIIQHEEKPADIDNSQTCKETRKVCMYPQIFNEGVSFLIFYIIVLCSALSLSAQ